MVHRGGGDRTHDLWLKRETPRYTPTLAIQRGPMKSARKGNCFRLVSAGVVHRSRTIARTISGSRGYCFSDSSKIGKSRRASRTHFSSSRRLICNTSSSSFAESCSTDACSHSSRQRSLSFILMGYSWPDSNRLLRKAQRQRSLAGPCSLNPTFKANSARNAPANGTLGPAVSLVRRLALPHSGFWGTWFVRKAGEL